MSQPHHEIEPHATKCKTEKKLSKTLNRARTHARTLDRKKESFEEKKRERERELLLNFEICLLYFEFFFAFVSFEASSSIFFFISFVHTQFPFSMQFVCYFKILRLYFCWHPQYRLCRYSFSSIGKLANVHNTEEEEKKT